MKCLREKEENKREFTLGGFNEILWRSEEEELEEVRRNKGSFETEVGARIAMEERERERSERELQRKMGFQRQSIESAEEEEGV